VDAIDRANIDACGVLGSHTGLSDYVRHRDSPWGDIGAGKSENPSLFLAEKTGLYHQTARGTSRILFRKSIARLDRHKPAAYFGFFRSPLPIQNVGAATRRTKCSFPCLAEGF
jgi:hypothetical protein